MAFLELEKGTAASDFFNNVTGASERTRMMLNLELKHTFGEPPQLDKYLETFGAKRCCYTDLEKYLLAGSWDQTKVCNISIQGWFHILKFVSKYLILI